MADNFRKSRAEEEIRKFDSISHAITTNLEEERMVHDGFLFYASYREDGVGSGLTSEALFIPGADKSTHVKRLKISASLGPVSVDFFEAPTVTANGVVQTIVSANRANVIIPDSQLFANPTITSDGDNIGGLYVPGGSIFEGVVGSTDTIEELIVAPNTPYLIRLTNETGGAINVGASIVWYEVGYES